MYFPISQEYIQRSLAVVIVGLVEESRGGRDGLFVEVCGGGIFFLEHGVVEGRGSRLCTWGTFLEWIGVESGGSGAEKGSTSSVNEAGPFVMALIPIKGIV
ncbi:hypothetical protein MRB53_016682 [Persea americana]|uniref:Uncharacterized protein n=1 Tax=Persea americana TaxID=3435 RepID=A0ACC2M3E6_PERAE|nr:hypothetical protein MRB53_016682 [Persea americana]